MTIPEPLTDQALSSELSRKLQADFKLEGAALAELGLSANLEYLDNVTLKFANVVVLQQADDIRLRIRNQSLGPECSDLVKQYRQKNLAFQTSSALKADIEYKINFKAGASAEARNLLIDQLKAKIGFSVSTESTDSVVGKGLFYGLVVEPIS